MRLEPCLLSFCRTYSPPSTVPASLMPFHSICCREGGSTPGQMETGLIWLEVCNFELEPLSGTVKLQIKVLIWEYTHLKDWLGTGKHLLIFNSDRKYKLFILTTQGQKRGEKKTKNKTPHSICTGKAFAYSKQYLSSTSRSGCCRGNKD